MGDFNYSYIDWVKASLSQEREIGFLDMLNDSAQELLVMEPTRGQLTLHLVLCGTQDLVRDMNVTGLLGNTDHAANSFAVHFKGKCEANLTQKPLISEGWTSLR